MLVILLAWTFISLLCWAWGRLVIQQLPRILKTDLFPSLHFSIVCMAGLACITTVTAIISLIMPVGSWLTYLIVIIPCFLLALQKQTPNFFSVLKNEVKGFHPVTWFLLSMSLVLALVMSSWKVNHPDTLAYHAQTIQWIEKYKIVPGLVHLNPRYGYQGLWFVAEAFFSFSFTGTSLLTAINSLVVAWFLFFIIQKINKYFLAAEWVNSFLWLLLFSISCLSYTQVRLTVTSASPDFITTLFLWLIFYLLVRKEAGQSPLYWLSLILLSVFSITLKLSAAPVIIVAIYSFIRLWWLRYFKTLIFSIILVAAIFFPFLARNIVTSGYPFYPSAFPDIANVDWKLDKTQTLFEKNYIKAFARSPVDYDLKKINAVIEMPVESWLPVWWRNQQAADKIILIALLLSFAICLLRFKLILRANTKTKVALITSASGIAFWFILAPDPRFGFGFIIGFIAVVLALYFEGKKPAGRIFRPIAVTLLLLASLIIGGYSYYRSVHFFSKEQIVWPIGIEPSLYSVLPCNDTLFNKPTGNNPCADVPVPCISSGDCDHFKMRGNKIGEGFKAK